MTVLVGGVGQLYQGDLDLGRVAVERLAGEQLGRHVVVEELHYGAIAVAQRLQELRPELLVLIGAEQRGRPPGTVQRRRIDPGALPADRVQVAVSDAVTGYVAIDLVVEVAAGLGVLPPRTVAVEVEPAQMGPGDGLSPAASAALEEALELVRVEVHRGPLLRLALELRELLEDGHLEPAPAVEALEDVLAGLDVLDREGRWDRTFADRDRLRLRIADGVTGEGMHHLDWGLWWTLIEELDRLQALEVRTSAEHRSTAP